MYGRISVRLRAYVQACACLCLRACVRVCVRVFVYAHVLKVFFYDYLALTGCENVTCKTKHRIGIAMDYVTYVIINNIRNNNNNTKALPTQQTSCSGMCPSSIMIRVPCRINSNDQT